MIYSTISSESLLSAPDAADSASDSESLIRIGFACSNIFFIAIFHCRVCIIVIIFNHRLYNGPTLSKLKIPSCWQFTSMLSSGLDSVTRKWSTSWTWTCCRSASVLSVGTDSGTRFWSRCWSKSSSWTSWTETFSRSSFRLVVTWTSFVVLGGAKKFVSVCHGDRNMIFNQYDTETLNPKH